MQQPEASTSAKRTREPSTSEAPEADFEYGDPVKFTCLLCSRQFKDVAQLIRHNRESALHKVRPLRVDLRTLPQQRAQGNLEKGDLCELARTKKAAAASEQPLLRRYTTSPGYRLATDDGTLQYVNSNGLVRAGTWKIDVRKTGYIREAGYTLLMQYSGYHVGNPALFDNMNWDPVKDFAPVAMATLAPHVFTVHPSVKANNLAELAALAKANPGTLKYGSSGNGSIQHIATEVFAQMTGTKMVHLPYKGTSGALNDLLGGRLDIVNTTPPPMVPHIKAGKLKALAYTSDVRHPMMPDVPTSAEAGLPGYEIASWFAVFAPAKTPPAVIDRLAREVRAVVESEDYKRRIEEQGAFAVYKGPEELGAFAAKEIEYWGGVIRSAGVKAEEQ